MTRKDIDEIIASINGMYTARSLTRNIAILMAYRQGHKPAEIARHFHISRQKVDQIIDRMEYLLGLAVKEVNK